MGRSNDPSVFRTRDERLIDLAKEEFDPSASHKEINLNSMIASLTFASRTDEAKETGSRNRLTAMISLLAEIRDQSGEETLKLAVKKICEKESGVAFVKDWVSRFEALSK